MVTGNVAASAATGADRANPAPIRMGEACLPGGRGAFMAGMRFSPLVLLACFVPLSLPAQEGGNFAPLWNGKDLTEWVNVNGAPETWSVREPGVIHCTGKPICALRTRRQYENFVFELEWRHLKPGGNAGVFIWGSAIAARGQPFLRAIEVQVLDHGYNAGGKNEWYTTHGDVFPIHGSSMQPFGRHNGQRSFPSEERSKPSPEWNHYRIDCRDGVLRLSVNGKEVSGGEKCVWRKGYLALESEGSPVEFRNLRLMELPPSSTPLNPDESAPEDLGWEPLYNGVDLRGWQAALAGPAGAAPQAPGGWQPRDWKLGFKPAAADGGHGLAWSGRRFTDVELIADVHLPKLDDKDPAAVPALEGGLMLAGGVDGPAVFFGAPSPQGLALLTKREDRGQWHRVHLRVTGDRIAVEVNGQPVGEVPGSGRHAGQPDWPLGLVDFGRGMEWANLYARPLP